MNKDEENQRDVTSYKVTERGILFKDNNKRKQRMRKCKK